MKLIKGNYQAGGVNLELIKREFDEKIYIPDEIKERYGGRRMVFFDIETLGLNPQFYPIILIGMSYEESGKYIVEQIFAEDILEEENILGEFKERIDPLDVIVSYNGKNFDVPYINKRMERYRLDFSLNNEHLDVICYVRPNKRRLGLQSCSLKNVEKYLDLNRDDTIDGAESITLYNRYVKSREDALKQKIMLHNFEDVYNLPKILKIFDSIEFETSSSDLITYKQKTFLSSLLRNNSMKLLIDIDSLSKMQASKLIDYMLKGTSCEYVNLIERK